MKEEFTPEEANLINELNLKLDKEEKEIEE